MGRNRTSAPIPIIVPRAPFPAHFDNFLQSLFLGAPAPCSLASLRFYSTFPWRDHMARKSSVVAGGLFVDMLENRTFLSATRIGTFAPASGAWALRSSPSAGSADAGTFQFGAYIPVVGDWNGDGASDIGTFNPA